MNILPSTRRPDCCPVCGSFDKTVMACSKICLRVGASDFVDGTQRDSHALVLHLHVTCDRCRFVWLTHVHDAEEAKGAW